MKLTGSLKRFSTLVAALSVIPAAAFALDLTGAGGKVGLVEPENGSGTAAFGAHLEFTQPGSAWNLIPNVLYWDEGSLTGLSVNADMAYRFGYTGGTSPYLGAGVGLNRFDFSGSDGSSTEIGLNLFGGLRFPAGTSTLFVEGRYTASDVSQTSLLGGVTFPIAR